MSQQSVTTCASFSLTWRVDLLLTLVTLEARRARAPRVVALVDLRVGITKLDGNVTLQLIFEPDSLHLRDSLHNSRLAVCDVSDSTDVDCGLARNNFGRQRCERRQIESLWVGLLGEFWTLRLRSRGRCTFLHRRLEGLLFHVKSFLFFNIILAVRRIQHGRARLRFIVGKIAVGSHDCDKNPLIVHGQRDVESLGLKEGVSPRVEGDNQGLRCWMKFACLENGGDMIPVGFGLCSGVSGRWEPLSCPVGCRLRWVDVVNLAKKKKKKQANLSPDFGGF